MIIYRVQDCDGRGPWKPGFSHRWVEDRPDHDELVPFIHDLGMQVLANHIQGMAIGCGCRTLEQLRRWFTRSEYEKLLGFGYRAVQLEAGRILGQSKIQLVFERVDPLRIGAVPVDLYPEAALV